MDPVRMARPDAPTMYFVGVTTGRSAINSLFPQWAAALGLADARMVGVDLPISAPAGDYRRVVAHLKSEPLARGALVTSHKIDLLAATADLFDELDEYAQLCHEVSCISKRSRRLIGQAKDLITVGLAIQQIVKPGHWAQSGAEIACLGAGGAGVALSTYLLTHAPPEDRPARLLVVDRDPSRLEKLATIIRALPPSGIRLDPMLSDSPGYNDRLVTGLPPGSMVVNATGMGKDLPGSPITDEALFPERGIVWELNYRGELDFLRQARAQAQARSLTIHDGWHYFLVGWSAIIAEIFHVEIAPAQFDRLAAIAGANRAGGQT